MAPDLPIVTTAVALPFVAAVLSPLLYRVLGERTGYAGASSRRPVSDCWRQRSIVTARSGRHGSPLSTWGPVHRRWVGAPLRTPRQRHRRPRVRLLGGVHARRGGVSTLLRGTAGVHGFDTRRRARLRSRVHLPVLGADQPLFVRAHRPLYRRQRVALLGTDGHGRHRGRWPVSARGVAHARGGGAGRPRRRDLRSDGDDRERRGDARLPSASRGCSCRHWA